MNYIEKGIYICFPYKTIEILYCDKKGEYGLTQWCYCIYDNENNSDNILFVKLIYSYKLIENL